MIDEIKDLLKLTFGLVTNKLRTYGAEKLQDGDLTDQKFRDWIVRELDDVKSKLDAISRKDLCVSISFLQQGIRRLYTSFGESSESDNSSELPGKQSQATTTVSAGACSSNKKPPHQAVAVEDAVALANAIGKLKIESNEGFKLAKKSFEEAAKEASRAFHNPALSTDERVLASKVRIESGILQHLKHPEFAATDCLQYLRELHDMPAIKEIFSVHLGKGIKSWFKSGFNKDSRAEIVESVMMMNWILADFITKFTKQRMAVFDWPMIECGTQVVHPIHYDKKSLPNMEKITPPWDIVGTQGRDVFYGALTTKEDLIFEKDLDCEDFTFAGLEKLDKTTGKMQPFCRFPLEDNTEHPQIRYVVYAIAVDKDDAVYVLLRDKNEDNLTLSIYSKDGRNTLHCLTRLNPEMLRFEHITVTNDKTIVICFSSSIGMVVELCDCTGRLINFDPFYLPFPRESGRFQVKSVFASCDEVIIITWDITGNSKPTNRVYNWSTDGQLKTSVKFHPSECKNTYDNLCYNHDTNTIIGHVWEKKNGKILIEYLSGQTAELQLSYVLYDTNFPEKILYSDLLHNANTGTLALANCNHLILLQKPAFVVNALSASPSHN